MSLQNSEILSRKNCHILFEFIWSKEVCFEEKIDKVLNDVWNSFPFTMSVRSLVSLHFFLETVLYLINTAAKWLYRAEVMGG